MYVSLPIPPHINSDRLPTLPQLPAPWSGYFEDISKHTFHTGTVIGVDMVVIAHLKSRALSGALRKIKFMFG